MGIQAGVGESDITPDESVPIAGNGPIERWSTGVHDPLSTTALVLDDGKTVIGIVSADLLWVSQQFVSTIHKNLTVPIDEIVITATHTHSGPYLPARFEDVVEFHPSELGFTEENITEVRRDIRAKTIDALIDAYESRSSAALRLGSASNAHTPLNRRAIGGIFDEVDAGNQTVDPELIALYVETDVHDAVLYNYGLHTTTMGGTEFSADWPRIVTRRIQETIDENAVTLFLNGAGGDIVPRNSYDWEEQYDSRREFSQAIGTEVAETVLEALDDAHQIENPLLDTARHELNLPLRSFDRASLERQCKELTDEIDSEELDPDEPLYGPSPLRKRFYIDQQLAIDSWEIDTLPVFIQYIEIGPAGLITLPGEPFVQHGLDLKSRAHCNPLFVAGYANGMVGYLPTVEAFQHGGYEIETARVSQTAIQNLREAAFSLITPESQ